MYRAHVNITTRFMSMKDGREFCWNEKFEA